MKILQLCCFTNLWGPKHLVESFDLKHGRSVYQIPLDYGKYFDLVCAAPPCTQFSKANSRNWKGYPARDIKLAQTCFNICQSSSGFWFLENPPGRIERFLPSLTKFRTLTWSGTVTNKEYILYSNFIILTGNPQRYGRQNIPRAKVKREEWQPDLIDSIMLSLNLRS